MATYLGVVGGVLLGLCILADAQGLASAPGGGLIGLMVGYVIAFACIFLAMVEARREATQEDSDRD